MRRFSHYILEAFLIVFSVLFALFIENYVAEHKRQKEKTIALVKIRQEIERNSKILADWRPHHQKIHSLLRRSSLTGYDSLKTILSKYDYFNIGVLSSEPLANAVLTTTAWESARSTGIISEFDFELVEELTQLYSLQTTLMEGSFKGVVMFFFDRETHDPANLNATLRQFELRFKELTGQDLSQNYTNRY